MIKYPLIILFIPFVSCYQNEDRVKVLAQHQLGNGDTIRLEIRLNSYLGATTPNVTWISKIENNQSDYYIGKIRRWLDKGELTFQAVNDSLVEIHYVDSSWRDISVYQINLLRRIYPNDGSDYIDEKTNSRRH